MDDQEPLSGLLGTLLPDLSLPDEHGRPYPLRRHVGHHSLVLFFFIRHGTPG